MIPVLLLLPAWQMAAQEPVAEQVVDIGELMDLFMKPMYEDLKSAMEKGARGRKQMSDVYRAAARLAEASNLLFSRSLNRQTESDDWPKFGAALRQAAADTAEATFVALRNARPQDFEPVKVKYRAVADSCNACHRGLKTDAKPVRP